MLETISQIADNTALGVEPKGIEVQNNFSATTMGASSGSATALQIQTYCTMQAKQELYEDDHLYIPLNGSFTPHADKLFNLRDEIDKFLISDKKELLLLAEGGSGKSLFGQLLTRDLANNYALGKSIPLFVLLPALHQLSQQVMAESLIQAGFPESSHQELQKTQSFVLFLDAFDEFGRWENIYQLGGLDQWNVKVIITCRPSYLTTVPNYRQYFFPFAQGKSQPHQLQEMYVAPFSIQQIDAYIGSYLALKHTELAEVLLDHPEWEEDWLEKKTYLNWIYQIPNLKNLVQTPFLLKVTMEVLPNIVLEYRSEQTKQSHFQMTGAKLYDVFIERWFYRQEEKLIARDCHPGVSNLQADYWYFAEQLALLMRQHNISNVLYRPRAIQDSTPEGPWEQFFSDQDVAIDQKNELRKQVRILSRVACPLRKLGPNRYEFLHPTILEYFVSKASFTQLLNERMLKEEYFKKIYMPFEATHQNSFKRETSSEIDEEPATATFVNPLFQEKTMKDPVTIGQELCTATRSACERGENDTVKSLLEISTNECNLPKSLIQLLYIAIKYQHSSIVDILFKQKNLDLLIKDEAGNTILHEVIKLGYLEMVKTLHTKNQNLLNMQNNEGISPFLLAAMSNNEQILKYLVQLNKGVDVKKRLVDTRVKDIHKNTVYHILALRGFSHLTDYLLKSALEIEFDTPNQIGQSPLCIAILQSQHKTAKALIDKGANCHSSVNVSLFEGADMTEMTPIQLAVALGDQPMIKMLKDVPNIKLLGENLLRTAIQFNQLGAFKFLIENCDLKPEVKDKWGKVELATFAARAGRINFIDTMVNLYELDPNAVDRRDEGLLHHGVRGKQLNLILEIWQKRLEGWTIKWRPNKDRKDPYQLAEVLEQAEQDPAEKDAYQIIKTVLDRISKGEQLPFKQIRYQNLVLQGGGAKCIAYVGALEALEKKFMEQGYSLNDIKDVTGTSAGSIVAVLLAVGYQPDEIKNELKKTNFSQLLDYQTEETLDSFIATFPNFIKEQRKPGGLEIFTTLWNEYWETSSSVTHKYKNINLRQGLCSGEKLREWVDNLIAAKVAEQKNKPLEECRYLTFGELEALIKHDPGRYKHLNVVGTLVSDPSGIPAGKVFRSTDAGLKDYIISDLIRISTSLPFIFRPHQPCRLNYEGGKRERVNATHDQYSDGGLDNNYPVEIHDEIAYDDQTHIKYYKTNEHTLGLSLLSKEEIEYYSQATLGEAREINNFNDIATTILSTFWNHETIQKFKRDDIKRRTIRIDYKNVGTTATDIDLDNMLEAGKNATFQFFESKQQEYKEDDWFFEEDTANSILPNSMRAMATQAQKRNTNVQQDLFKDSAKGEKQIQTSSASQLTPWFSPIGIFSLAKAGYKWIKDFNFITSKPISTISVSPFVPLSDSELSSINLSPKTSGKLPDIISSNVVKCAARCLLDVPETTLSEFVAINSRIGCNNSVPTEQLAQEVNRGLTLSEKFVAMQYVAHYIRKYSPITFPWNKKHTLTSRTRQELCRYQKQLSSFEKIMNSQKHSRAYQVGLFKDKFNYFDKKLHQLKRSISNITKYGQIVDSNLYDIRNNMYRLGEIIHQLAQHNRELKMFAIKEKRSERKYQSTGSKNAVIIHYNPISGKLTQKVEVLAQSNATENNLCMTEQLFSMSSFAKSQQFWSQFPARLQLFDASQKLSLGAKNSLVR
jgi:ankyrin repeat protein/predicted acylesterase/phospholipase RssA